MPDLEPITTRDKALRALQLVEIEALKELDRICRKHGIKYSLGGGTCLGQARHGGFIPWDDDIDVDMTSENYSKFLQVAPLELDAEKFFLRTRATSSAWKRSYLRIEVKNTKALFKHHIRLGMHTGFFVDIFELNYMPNNRLSRKLVTSLLACVRNLEYFKNTNIYSFPFNPKRRLFWTAIKRIAPYRLLFSVENVLKNCRKKKRTGWLLASSDHATANRVCYPSEGVDEYEDVTFEGIKVMNKRGTHGFLAALYGESYMEWLSPAARISEHSWWNVSFGPYAERLCLPDNYADYLTVKYNEDKLRAMQRVSLEMAEMAMEICKANDLTCWLLGDAPACKRYGVEEWGGYWLKPLAIALPRDDFDRLEEIAPERLAPKYFWQSERTDSGYKLPYPRIRLNLTEIRESSVPKYMEEMYNTGFFIKVVPLDNTSDIPNERKRHLKRLKRLNHLIDLKWKKGSLFFFIKANLKAKIKLLLLLPVSHKRLVKALDKERRRYSEEDTGFYIDSSGYQLGGKTFDKEYMGAGEYMEYNGHTLSFPSDLEGYCKAHWPSEEIETLSFFFLKNEFRENYKRYMSCLIEKKIDKIQKDYPYCHLNYYDDPEYQLSVLRYDEKAGRYLSNEEILEQYANSDAAKRWRPALYDYSKKKEKRSAL